jgi:hypothetical protein
MDTFDEITGIKFSDKAVEKCAAKNDSDTWVVGCNTGNPGKGTYDIAVRSMYREYSSYINESCEKQRKPLPRGYYYVNSCKSLLPQSVYWRESKHTIAHEICHTILAELDPTYYKERGEHRTDACAKVIFNTKHPNPPASYGYASKDLKWMNALVKKYNLPIA